MNIRDLKYVVELAKHQNFARASESSNVSQPALSMQIKKLEDELGVKIFERDKKNFLITKIGKEIIKQAELTILASEELKRIAKNAKNPQHIEVRIGAFPTLASYFFAKIIKKIRQKFPNLTIFLYEEKSEVLISKLRNGEIDLIFLASATELDFADCKKIFSEQFFLATPLKHPLTKRNKITQKDLKNLEIMLLAEGHCLRDQALEICSTIGSKTKTDFSATSLETLKLMVETNNAITLIPEIAIKKTDKIHYHKISDDLTRTVNCYWRKSAININLCLEIAGLASDEVSKI